MLSTPFTDPNCRGMGGDLMLCQARNVIPTR
jgi:hypothetical protein